MIPGFPSRRAFSSLSEQEILALAISSEEEDSRIYATYAERLSADFPQTAAMFHAMAAEEDSHRRRLIEVHRRRFGETIPLVRREHVAGFYSRRPYWLVRSLGLERVRGEAMAMEAEARNFYRRAAERTSDAQTRSLLGDLAAAETGHMRAAEGFEREHLGADERQEEATTQRRLFLLQIVQPGLAGLMDGSVSTLAPLFAAAFATQSTWETFLVGMAASVGAGISMGFAEALSDDGALTGRGSPLIRGFASGIMTTLGGVGHALPYLIPDFTIATSLAIIVVLFELWAIAWIRWKYMDTPFLRAAYQIVLGGGMVFAAGILIGNA